MEDVPRAHHQLRHMIEFYRPQSKKLNAFFRTLTRKLGIEQIKQNREYFLILRRLSLEHAGGVPSLY